MTICPVTPPEPSNSNSHEMRLELVFNASPKMKQLLKRGWVIVSHLITATLTAWAVQQPISINALPERIPDVLTEVVPLEPTATIEQEGKQP